MSILSRYSTPVLKRKLQQEYSIAASAKELGLVRIYCRALVRAQDIEDELKRRIV